MEHKHKYDAQGKQLCCTPQEEKIYTDANAKKLLENITTMTVTTTNTAMMTVTTTEVPINLPFKCFYLPLSVLFY